MKANNQPKEERREPCCADCKSHTNHPSYCHLHKKYVGRKNPLCQDGRMK